MTVNDEGAGVGVRSSQLPIQGSSKMVTPAFVIVMACSSGQLGERLKGGRDTPSEGPALTVIHLYCQLPSPATPSKVGRGAGAAPWLPSQLS